MSELTDWLKDNPQYKQTTPAWILQKIEAEKQTEEDPLIHESLRIKDAEIERLRGLRQSESIERSEKDAEIELILTKAEKDKNVLLVALEAATKEIERLRSLAYFQMAGETITWKEVAQSKGRHLLPLIAELADALVKDDQNYIWYNEGDDLIQRAREATKDE